ncbi:hypothetical protein AB0J42_27935 [Nonomuraea sp. NPDC049649]|uniref:hypothetical protein n=1 Tax=Nonomuraea sp. NPDC049649 TaxID=3155776 RepID=UPI0034218FD3
MHIAALALALLATATPATPHEPVTFHHAAGHHKGKKNSRNRGNYWNQGKSVNSGNFSNVIDSYKSNNDYSGSGNNANGPQRLTVRTKNR